MSIKLNGHEIEKVKFHVEIITKYQNDFEKMRFALSKSQETLMGYLNGVVIEREEDPSKNYQLNLDGFTLEPTSGLVSNNGSDSIEAVKSKSSSEAENNPLIGQ